MAEEVAIQTQTSKLGLNRAVEGVKIDDVFFNDNVDIIDNLMATSTKIKDSDKVDGYHVIVASSLPSTVTNGALCFVYSS